MKNGICSLVLLYLMGTNVTGQDVLTIHSVDQANDQIDNYIYVYEDTANTMGVDQLISEDYSLEFIPLKEFTRDPSVDYSYWIRLSIENKTKGDTPLGLSFNIRNQIIELYTLTDEHQISLQKTGFYITGRENEEMLPATNVLELSDAPSLTALIKIRNDVYDDAPDLDVKVVNIKKQLLRHTRLSVFDGIIQGMLWVMILFGISLYLVHKNRLYLLYSGYIFCLSIWYLGCFALAYNIFPAFPRKIFPYTDIPVYIANIIYLSFILEFINSARLIPKWIKYIRLMQLLLVLDTVMVVLIVSLTRRIYVAYTCSDIVILALLILTLSLVIKLYTTRDNLALVIALGSSFMLIGTIVATTIWIITTNDDVLMIQQIAVIMELLIFTFGISYRFRLIETDKRKIQDQLIVQLNENKELQEKAKRELEQKVKERTAEIAKSKEEIEAQRDEIETQLDTITSQKNLIEIQNQSVTESIRYASRLQNALLPSDELIKYFLPKHFILNKPCEIVSGDFYWVGQKNNRIIVIVADCTGHGVPGAFMSLLGISLLNEIVNKAEVIQANEILNELREQIIISLGQTGKESEPREGMDIALCMLDPENGKIQFSGANNPLYLVRSGKLTEIKGDAMPVGIDMQAAQSFTNHDVSVQKGDSIYLFSDGYADQYGGEHSKKYGYKKFQELLLSVRDMIMFDQKTALEDAFESWKGSNEQIDDVLVMGIRI